MTNDMESGEYQVDITLDLEHSAPFYIVDAIQEAYDVWDSLRPGDGPPKIQVVLSPDDTGSWYNDQFIHIESTINEAHAWPDTYDKDVIIHEYGHHITKSILFFDNYPLGVESHSWDEQHTEGLAASEGFSTFFANVVRDTAVFLNFYNDFTKFAWTNSESGEFGANNLAIPAGSGNNYGDRCEAAVAGILWDIYDDDPITDDWSTFGVWPQPYYSIPDGIGDTLAKGPDNILKALMDRTVDGHRPDDINELWEAWFSLPFLGHRKGMMDIYKEHGIVDSCCIGLRGNADGDPNDQCDISDLTFLVDFAFEGGLPPVCYQEALVSNISPDISIIDITYLISYLFGGGPAPYPCIF
ncbi:MAG: hypothetical protein P1R58_01750 [bacterium]|nr:hypothetical protein [bacterium]